MRRSARNRTAREAATGRPGAPPAETRSAVTAVPELGKEH